MQFAAEWAMMLLTIPGADNWMSRRGRFRIAFEVELERFRRPMSAWLKATPGSPVSFDELLPLVVDRNLRRFGVVENSFYGFSPALVRELFRAARTDVLRRLRRESHDEHTEDSWTAGQDFEIELYCDVRDAIGWTREEFITVAHWVFGRGGMDEETERSIRVKMVDAVESSGRSAEQTWSGDQEALNAYLKGARQIVIAQRRGEGLAHVNKRLRRAAERIAGRLNDARLASSIHDLVEQWSKRARRTPPEKEDEHAAHDEPTDYFCPDRWERFHVCLLRKLADYPLHREVTRLAPTLTVDQLETLVAGSARDADLESVLEEVHATAMSLFARPSAPSPVRPRSIEMPVTP